MPNTQTNLSSVEEQNSTKNARSYLERNVTKYTSVTEKTGVPRTIAQCLAFIRDNKKQAALVEALRPLYQRAEELCLKQTDEAAKAAYQEAKSEYDAAKKKLSAVTLSGTFTKRAIDELETYSGIIQADLDHLHREGVDICELKKRLSLDPHVLFCFVSPGGDGFKIGIPVATGPEDHTEAFLAMQRYFQSTHGILPDGACKDICRLCFLSSDPEVFINENAVALDWRALSASEETDDETDDDPIVLPLDALPQVMQSLATSCAEVYQVEPTLPAVAALTILSAAIGNTVSCAGAVNGRMTPCNLMSVIVAPSGYGKGVIGIVGKPLTDASAEIVQHFEQFIRPSLRSDVNIADTQKKQILGSFRGDKLSPSEQDSARTKLRALEIDIERWAVDLQQPPALYIGSATGAALGMALKRNGEQMLSLALEAGDAIRVAAGRFSKDAKGDYDLLLSGYTGEPYSEARITRASVRLEAPCLSVLWACQPSLCAELYGTAEAQERGLLARLNVVRCDDDVTPLDDGVIRNVPTELTDNWKNLVLDALQLRKEGRKIVFQAERAAAQVFRDFHNEAVALRNGEGRESEAKLKRCRENAIRIALVIAAAEWLLAGAHGDEPTLTAEHAARGVAFARYFLAETLKLTHCAVAQRRHARLEELLALVSQAGGSIPLRRLRDHHGFGETELKQIVERNPDVLKIEMKEPSKKGGRPSPRLIVIRK